MMEMPPVLTNLINHLLNTYGGVKSWNIFESDNGTVNVNIRFPNITSDCLVGHVEPVSYRRVPTRQAERSKHRAEAYRSKQLTHSSNVHTQTCNVTSPQKDSKKRKMDTCSPEIARNNCDELCAIDKYNIDTPIKLENAKVEYQVQPHDESFSSCTSDAQSAQAQDYEIACSKILVEQTMSAVKRMEDPDKYTTSFSPLSVTSPSSVNPGPKSVTNLDIMCPCCEIKMTPDHVCNMEKPQEPDPPDVKTDNYDPGSLQAFFQYKLARLRAANNN